MPTLGRRTAGLGATTLLAAALVAGTTVAASGADRSDVTRPAATDGDLARAALSAIAAHRGAVHASDAQAFTVTGVLVDPDGTRHVRVTRSYRGSPCSAATWWSTRPATAPGGAAARRCAPHRGCP